MATITISYDDLRELILEAIGNFVPDMTEYVLNHVQESVEANEEEEEEVPKTKPKAKAKAVPKSKPKAKAAPKKQAKGKETSDDELRETLLKKIAECDKKGQKIYNVSTGRGVVDNKVNRGKYTFRDFGDKTVCGKDQDEKFEKACEVLSSLGSSKPNKKSTTQNKKAPPGIPAKRIKLGNESINVHKHSNLVLEKVENEDGDIQTMATGVYNKNTKSVEPLTSEAIETCEKYKIPHVDVEEEEDGEDENEEEIEITEEQFSAYMNILEEGEVDMDDYEKLEELISLSEKECKYIENNMTELIEMYPATGNEEEEEDGEDGNEEDGDGEDGNEEEDDDNEEDGEETDLDISEGEESDDEEEDVATLTSKTVRKNTKK